MIPLQSNPLFRHLFLLYSPCNDPFWCTTPCTNQLLRIGMNAFSLSLCILYHYSTHTIKSQQLEVVYVIIESSPAWQWETPKSYPTIDTQTNKSCHTQSIHESDSRRSRNSSTTLHVFPQPQSHHREPWRWYPQSCSNDMPSFTDDSLSSPSTPSRISHCPRYSSPRQEPRHANDAGAHAQSQCVASVHPKGSFPARRQTCYNPSGRTGWNCPPFPPFHSSCSHCVHTSDSREWCQRTIPSFMTSEPISINSLLRQFGPIQWWLWFLISFQIACIPMKQYWCQSDNPLLPFSRTIP